MPRWIRKVPSLAKARGDPFLMEQLKQYQRDKYQERKEKARTGKPPLPDLERIQLETRQKGVCKVCLRTEKERSKKTSKLQPQYRDEVAVALLCTKCLQASENLGNDPDLVEQLYLHLKWLNRRDGSEE